MTASEYQALAAQVEADTRRVEGMTEQVILRGIVSAAETFDYNAPLPAMPNYRPRSWEAA